MLDFDGPMDMGMGLTISIISGGKKSSGFPYDDAEGFESPDENYAQLAMREHCIRRHPEMYEERTGAEIYGRELKQDRGYIQVPGQGPYFPHFY